MKRHSRLYVVVLACAVGLAVGMSLALGVSPGDGDVPPPAVHVADLCGEKAELLVIDYMPVAGFKSPQEATASVLKSFVDPEVDAASLEDAMTVLPKDAYGKTEVVVPSTVVTTGSGDVHTFLSQSETGSYFVERLQQCQLEE